MTCIETRDLFSALADDALTADERAALDTHLAGCAECRHELATFARTVQMVRAMDPSLAPAGFVDRVLAAAKPEPWLRRVARRVVRPWPAVPLSAAALLVIGGLAVLLFRASPEQQRFAQQPPQAEYRAQPPREEPRARPTDSARPSEPLHPSEPAPRTEPARPSEPAPRAAPAPSGVRDALSDAAAQQNVEPPTASAPSAPPAPRATPEPRAKTRSYERDVAKDEADQRADAPRKAPAIATAQSQATPGIARLSRTGPMPGIRAGSPDVTAQLRAADVRTAERSLVQLAARIGGRPLGRRVDGRRVVVELAVPSDAYADFVRRAAALGAVAIDHQAIERPVLAVAVTISD